ncbi:LANO_0H05842g1_1 [Lachancea nothofagi CBS 11611]|uniref:Mediator of RNA polymerase II transcription subunit 5 n=1 Tax=Lachancea nothofagi CBS 11611 TaxID=1266666 RepID=A0A1G4KLK1_9SACH|nr:LANO_0H05842g1_1 [Lachancea nothofagi CBS 11611]
MDEKRETIYSLALNCFKRRLPSNQFLNFYNELVNEQYGSIVNNSEETDTKIQDIDVYGELSASLLRILDSDSNVLIADYVTEVLFINYNTELAQRLIPLLYTCHNSSQLALLFSRASAFFLNLNDKLVIDQICDDLSELIIPSIFNHDFNTQDDRIVHSVAKFMHNILHLSNQPITITSNRVKENIGVLLFRLSKTNRLLHRKLVLDFETKLKFKGPIPNIQQENRSDEDSPSIISPKLTENLAASSKNLTSANAGSSPSQTVKLARYCKNLWLNNKILNWSTNEKDFVSNYGSIDAAVQKLTKPLHSSVENVMLDLIETAFTSFAQFVSNKHYHQPNSDFNLLERQWTIFITKQLPLYIMEHIPKKPDTVTTALENIDHKVIKALKSYASDKDDSKNRGEDLFEDLPNKNMDIRHDFLKNLILMGLQPAAVLNDYLREDQIVEIKSLPSTDSVIIKNAQGVNETIDSFSRFIQEKICDLDVESMFDINSGTMGSADNAIIQILRKFDTLAATKQRDLSEVFYELFCESARNFECKTLSKICCLVSFNISHSLTTMLAFVSPSKFLAVAIEFIDDIWESHMKNSASDISDDFEPNTEFVCFTYALIFVVNIVKTYNISLVEANTASFHISPQSFTIKLMSGLGNISPQLILKTNTEPTELLKSWVCDLFINGSISDSLMKEVNVKDLAVMIPFIFKQSVFSVEARAIREISALTGGFEYFLQPFLIVGLIGIVFWAEQFLTALRSKEISRELLDSIFEMLNSVLDPPTLSDESRPLHTLILRLNAIHLLKSARAFRTQSRSNYGIYSSESEGDPKLESLISHLEQVARSGNLYNVDPGSLSSDSGYPRKEIGNCPFSITAENSVNSILTNQVNSFWNLHSSTYYNLDYLFSLIEIITPSTFLEDVLSALQTKSSEGAIISSRVKELDRETIVSLDYLFYFLVTHDLKKTANKADLLQYMESSAESDLDNKKVTNESNFTAKHEHAPEEDFDMLFGEDTSIPGNETDIVSNDWKTDSIITHTTFDFLENSFAAVLHTLLLAEKNSYEEGYSRQEDYQQAQFYHDKYTEVLKSEAV